MKKQTKENLIFLIIILVTILVAGVVAFSKISANLFGKAEYEINMEIDNPEVEEIINWTDKQAWRAITGTAYSSRPTSSQVSKSIMDKRMKKIAVKKRIAPEYSGVQIMIVNKVIAPLWEEFFNDLYEQCQDFYIVSYDGAYVYREATGSTKMSAHAFGCAVDINAGIKGNGYGQKPYRKFFRNLLINDTVKYSTVYFDSPMLAIAHKYTLVNGADWSKPNDAMHFSFIGDWTREEARLEKSNVETMDTQDLKYWEIEKLTDVDDFATIYSYIEKYISSYEEAQINNLVDPQCKKFGDKSQIEKFIAKSAYCENEKLTITRYYVFGDSQEFVNGEEVQSDMAFIIRCDFDNMAVSVIPVKDVNEENLDEIRKDYKYVVNDITQNDDNKLRFISMNEEEKDK